MENYPVKIVFTLIKLKQAKQQQPEHVAASTITPQSVCVALEDSLANQVRKFKLHIVEHFKDPDMHNHDNAHS